MTKKDKVIAALEHRECDIIPFNADFTEQETQVMAAYTKNENFLDGLNCHMHYVQYWGWPTELADKPEHFMDDFGVIWNRSGADKDIGVVIAPHVVDLEDYHYQFPIVDEARLRREYADLVSTKGDKFAMAGFGFSMFERAWALCGMENVLMGMIANEEELKQLLSNICDYNLHLIDIALEYDIDGVYFGDDWGQQSGLIMGASHWRNFIKPNMKRMYDRVKSKRKFVLQHSCGDIEEIFDDLIEIGLDCYQTFQPEIYDIEKVKATYGARLCFWGGISTQRLLPYATPDEVKAETIRMMRVMKHGGGYIAAPTHALAFDVPPQNVLAMFEAFNQQN